MASDCCLCFLRPHHNYSQQLGASRTPFQPQTHLFPFIRLWAVTNLHCFRVVCYGNLLCVLGSHRGDQSAGQEGLETWGQQSGGAWGLKPATGFLIMFWFILCYVTCFALTPFLFLSKSEPGTGFVFFWKEMEALSSNEWKLLLMPWIKYLSAASAKRKSTPQRKQCLNCSLLIIAGFVIKLRKKACLGENNDHK